MNEKGPAYLMDLKLHLADDASHALVELISDKTASVAITQDQLTYVVARLNDLGGAWAKRQRAIDPTMGKPGTIMPVTATKPKNFGVGSLAGNEGVGISFEISSGHQTYLLANKDAEALAHRILMEIANPSKMPDRN